MRPKGGRIIVCVGLAGAGLSGCASDSGVEMSGTCGGDAPVIAFDHETTDPDRGIGGGVPEVSVMSADGDIELITGSWVASQADVSPDGEQLVVVKAEGDYESAGPESTALWIVGTDGSAQRELTGGDFLDEDPDWSPDGSSIVFVRIVLEGREFKWSVTTAPADGGETTELFSLRGDDKLSQPTWSPDGQRIAFVSSAYTESEELETTVWTMAADGSDAQPLAELPYVGSLDWHPDGTSLLVDADDQNQETYLVDAGTGLAQSLGLGADLATWSPDGRSVYYFREVDPNDHRWDIVEGRVQDGALLDDLTLLAGDDLDNTILAHVGLFPGFALAVGPCG
jgi:Tol biopolymer transport system component